MDVGSLLIKRATPESQKLGIAIMTNIIETDLGNPTMMRALAYKMEEIGRIDYALNLFERILRQR